MEVDFGMWESCIDLRKRKMNWTGHAVIIGMMDHKNTWRRKLKTEEVYGSSTPVLRGSRKGRVRLVQGVWSLVSGG
ncbi:hypothetical protein POTOM_024604 [Populus tomentosa]|uniref:Uncharacterized protein n=1 Tax=Populus tomentosa TaxID=118781 RepID=A0A8X7ZFN4_POPTO|nr:hypothetical protein POTOM_024604 [Populus tomentosa]